MCVSHTRALSAFFLLFVSGHSFPPDIGQGINAGLQDVVVLDRALKGVMNTHQPRKTSLGEALLTYQRNRRPEHRGLIRLARFGAPYQVSDGRQSAWAPILFAVVVRKR